MTPDLSLLVWTVVLTFVQVVIAAAGANAEVGLPTLAGNREDLPPIRGWAGRAQRAHRNMLENLPLFIALVLVAHIANRANGTSILGEQLFFWGRLVYAIVYIIGIPWVRTLLWAISVVGMILIFAQLV
ncbi:MAG TPA: MAPEG family protein [Acetobacteraceae bacterium]|nr:MAPEG family protein [Acetobacteraceae bacterium]